MASAARSFAGRPVAERQADNNRPSGANETTAVSNCKLRMSGPIASVQSWKQLLLRHMAELQEHRAWVKLHMGLGL